MEKKKNAGRSREYVPIHTIEERRISVDLSYLGDISHKPIETKIIGKTRSNEEALKFSRDRIISSNHNKEFGEV